MTTTTQQTMNDQSENDPQEKASEAKPYVPVTCAECGALPLIEGEPALHNDPFKVHNSRGRITIQGAMTSM